MVTTEQLKEYFEKKGYWVRRHNDRWAYGRKNDYNVYGWFGLDMYHDKPDEQVLMIFPVPGKRTPNIRYRYYKDLDIYTNLLQYELMEKVQIDYGS